MPMFDLENQGIKGSCLNLRLRSNRFKNTMPHSRERYAKSVLQKLLTHSPIVGLLGQRQVGKTTLAEGESREYSTLDLVEMLEFAEKNPSRFLENRQSPFTIDECQLAPPLFPALKERVRTHPRKGQFIWEQQLAL